MIDCRMNFNDKAVKINLKGHANYAEQGKDIVCAAASTLCNTFVEYIKTHKEIKLDYRLDKGDIYISAEAEKDTEWFWEVVCFMAVGFYIIACSYPKNFKFCKNF